MAHMGSAGILPSQSPQGKSLKAHKQKRWVTGAMSTTQHPVHLVHVQVTFEQNPEQTQITKAWRCVSLRKGPTQPSDTCETTEGIVCFNSIGDY